MCGWIVRRNDGLIEEVQHSSGSSFAVTRGSYLVTSKRLVEVIARHLKLQPEARIKAYCELRADEARPDSQRDKASQKRWRNQVRSMFNPERFVNIEPKIWVFFGDSGPKFEAELISATLRDVCILKIRRHSSPYFRLADSSRIPRQKTRVFTLGFSGALGERSIKASERHLSERSLKNSDSFQAQFAAADFVYSQTEGFIIPVANTKQPSRRFEYTEGLNLSSCGAPMVTEDGTVIAINVWIGPRDSESIGGHYTWTTSDLCEEIRAAIEKDKESSIE